MIIIIVKAVGVEREKFQQTSLLVYVVGSGTQGVQAVPLAGPPPKIKEPF